MSPTLPPCRHQWRCRGRRRLGLSLVETLISVAITSTLLTAVGAAYTASVQAVTINDQFFRASQTARVSLNQLLAELRQCSVVEVHPTTLNVVTAAGQAKTYVYDATNRKLILTMTDSLGVTTNHSLGSSITALSFAGSGPNVTITMTVEGGQNRVTLGGSVIPRRMVVYN